MNESKTLLVKKIPEFSGSKTFSEIVNPIMEKAKIAKIKRKDVEQAIFEYRSEKR